MLKKASADVKKRIVFCIDFSSIFNEKSMKKTTHCFIVVLAFLNMATLAKHRILQCESYFFIFRVYVLFLKKRRKKCPTMQRAFLEEQMWVEFCGNVFDIF